MTSYSFSLDRAVWTGVFASRAEALEAGLAHAREVDSPPETVYVGQRITPNDRAYGHAREIIHTMRRRVSEDNGELAETFLRQVSDKQVAELDNILEATIRRWLAQQNLAPLWVRIEAVSEHRVTVALSALR